MYGPSAKKTSRKTFRSRDHLCDFVLLNTTCNLLSRTSLASPRYYCYASGNRHRSLSDLEEKPRWYLVKKEGIYG